MSTAVNKKSCVCAPKRHLKYLNLKIKNIQFSKFFQNQFE